MTDGLPIGDRYTAPADAVFQRMENAVQVLMAVWVPGRGWLTTKRLVTLGRAEDGFGLPSEGTILHECRGGYRAMQYALRKED